MPPKTRKCRARFDFTRRADDEPEMALHPYVARQAWHWVTRPLRRGVQQWLRKNRESLTVGQLIPGRGRRALVLVAHPVDILFCLGIVGELKANQFEVAAATLTRGEGGDPGQNVRERLGTVRERELRASLAVYGIDRVNFLGYIDPPRNGGTARLPEFLPKKLETDISDQIKRFNADLVVSHGSTGEGWQPANLILHRFLRRSLRLLGRQGQKVPRLVTMAATTAATADFPWLNVDDVADLTVENAPHDPRRQQAVEAQSTEHAYLEALAGSVETFLSATASEGYRVW